LHGALVAGLLLSLFRAPVTGTEAPDLWQGDLVTVDTLSEGPQGSTAGTMPSPASAPEQHTPEPAAFAVLPPDATTGATQKHSESLKHNKTVKQSSVAPTTPKAKPQQQQPAKPVDPNEALLAKVMGFKPSSNSSSAASSGEESSVNAASAAPGGSHGEATVRNLPKAFTRALANAAAGDAARYDRMPAGEVEQVRATIEVGSKGEVTAHWLNREASTRMKDLVRRTIASLGAGQFALHETQVAAGSLELEIEVWLSGSSDGSPRVTEIGYDAPRPGHEGKAYFLFGSGRRFEAKVKQR
jgi:hypothetical protein